MQFIAYMFPPRLLNGTIHGLYLGVAFGERFELCGGFYYGRGLVQNVFAQRERKVESPVYEEGIFVPVDAVAITAYAGIEAGIEFGGGCLADTLYCHGLRQDGVALVEEVGAQFGIVIEMVVVAKSMHTFVGAAGAKRNNLGTQQCAEDLVDGQLNGGQVALYL